MFTDRIHITNIRQVVKIFNLERNLLNIKSTGETILKEAGGSSSPNHPELQARKSVKCGMSVDKTIFRIGGVA